LIHSLIRLGLAIREETRMNIRYHVELSEAERCELTALVGSGKHYARKIKRAQILLAADGGLSDEDIAVAVAVGGSTVYRTKRRFVEGNLEAALNEEPRAGADRKLTSNEEALLVATACSSPPEGRARWTLELLAGAMVKLTDHDSLSRETVRRRLAENHLKPWRKDMWCIPKVDAEYVARMEDVLDLYAEQPDPKRPVVCFDESPTQLIGEARQPIPAAPGRLERFDYEYRRNGAVNLFVFVDAHRSWRRVKVTGHRTADDFALCMRELVDVDFPEAERIRVVLDNLSTHTAAALYAAFTTPPSTPAGSTWLRSRSACSKANVSIAASTAATGSLPRSTPGSLSETKAALESTGCSLPPRREPKWRAPIPIPRSKSHNHCAGELVHRFVETDPMRRIHFSGHGL
jgi:transposase